MYEGEMAARRDDNINRLTRAAAVVLHRCASEVRYPGRVRVRMSCTAHELQAVEQKCQPEIDMVRTYKTQSKLLDESNGNCSRPATLSALFRSTQLSGVSQTTGAEAMLPPVIPQTRV